MPSDSLISQVSLNEYILFKCDIVDDTAEAEYAETQITQYEQDLRAQIAEARNQMKDKK